ncbi:hypothetical protein [Niabella aurantiaca]|uniref:hypothetical protein n=1 Tax=Niabella aurantiaca TaxID=379900 RepID=UPI00037AB871|nr:hypothetical protein [Niabella aurantiaca]
MKTKYFIPLVLLFTGVHTALAQTETVRFKAKAGVLLTTGELQKALNENFKMSSPTKNNDLSKPLRIAGYGVPGAKVEIHITPISKGGSSKPVLVVAGRQSPYDVQNYTATVGNNGSWCLAESVTVKFREGAIQRRVHVFAGQSKDGLVSKKPVNCEIKLKDKKLKVIAVATATLLTDDRVRSDFKVQTITGDMTQSTASPLGGSTGYEAFTIRGSAAPKSRIKVEAYYSGKKEVYKKSARAVGIKVYEEKETVNIKNKQLGSWDMNIGDDGRWSVPSIDPYQPKSGDAGTTLTMSEIVISIKAYNGNKEVVSKQVKLVALPNLPVFFK